MIGPYCQLTLGASTAFVAGSIPLVPSSMALIDGSLRDHTRLALSNSAAVLRGLHISPANTIRVMLYVTRREDIPHVQLEANAWLSEMMAARRDEAGFQLLLLQVGGLPMGAAVEAQLEAFVHAPDAPARLDWRCLTPDGYTVQCDALLFKYESSDALPEWDVAYSSLQCVLTANDILQPSVEALSCAIASAVEELASRAAALESPLQLGGAMYVRAFFDTRIGVEAASLSSAIELALQPRECAAFAAPVVCIGVAHDLLAVQACFVTTREQAC